MLEIGIRLGRLLQAASKVAFSPRYLLVTNTGITVCLSGTGDILQQRYEILRKRQTKWDPNRTKRICTTGLFIGPTCHYWYQFLDKFFPGKALRMITKKIILDQIIFSPVNIAMFLVIMGYQEGSSKEQIKTELIRDGADLFTAECLIWPPAQYINFYFLPLRFRLLFDNTISLGFDCYYSYVKYRKHKPTPQSNEDKALATTVTSHEHTENKGEEVDQYADSVICHGILGIESWMRTLQEHIELEEEEQNADSEHYILGVESWIRALSIL